MAGPAWESVGMSMPFSKTQVAFGGAVVGTVSSAVVARQRPFPAAGGVLLVAVGTAGVAVCSTGGSVSTGGVASALWDGAGCVAGGGDPSPFGINKISPPAATAPITSSAATKLRLSSSRGASSSRERAQRAIC